MAARSFRLKEVLPKSTKRRASKTRNPTSNNPTLSLQWGYFVHGGKRCWLIPAVRFTAHRNDHALRNGLGQSNDCDVRGVWSGRGVLFMNFYLSGCLVFTTSFCEVPVNYVHRSHPWNSFIWIKADAQLTTRFSGPLTLLLILLNAFKTKPLTPALCDHIWNPL